MMPRRHEWKDGEMAWARGFGGALLVLVGIVWIGQGLNILRGSGMSGHALFAVLGAVAALAGLALLWSLTRMRARAGRPVSPRR